MVSQGDVTQLLEEMSNQDGDENQSPLGVINNYHLLSELGSGSQGVVYKSLDTLTNTLVAIKVLPNISLKPQRLPSTSLFNLKQEIAVLKLIDHPNLVRLIEIIDDPVNNVLYLVTKLVMGFVLEIRAYPESDCLDWLEQIASGLFYLHAQNIIHKDIKPSNLMNENGTIKICDFGISTFTSDSKSEKLLGTDDLIDATSGTLEFLPPEAFTQTVFNGRPADMYALGVTLHCLLFGRLPGKVGRYARCHVLLKMLLQKDVNKRVSAKMLYEKLSDKSIMVQKVTPNLTLIEKAVSGLKNFVMSEKINELKFLTNVEHTLDTRIVPDLSKLQLAMSTMDTPSTASPATKNILASGFIQSILDIIQQLQIIDDIEAEIKLCQQLLSEVNSSYLNVFAIFSGRKLPLAVFNQDGYSNFVTQQQITQGQVLELQGKHLAAAEVFYQLYISSMQLFTQEELMKPLTIVRQKKHRIVIIGYGYAGAWLAECLSKQPDIEVIIIEQNTYFMHKISSLRACVRGAVYAHRTVIPHNNPRIRVARVDEILITQNKVVATQINGTETRSSAIIYDYLVCATGSMNKSLASPKNENAESWYSQTSAQILSSSKILIVGGGVTAFELCGEILAKYPLKHITVVCHVGSAQIFKDVGIKTIECAHFNMVNLEKTGYSAGPFSFQGELYDLVLPCTGNIPNNRPYPVNWLNQSGHVTVNQYLQVGAPNVFCVGDINNIPEEKTASNALRQAQTTFRNLCLLTSRYNYKRPLHRHQPGSRTLLVSFGDKPFGAQKLKYFGKSVSSRQKAKSLLVAEVWKLLGQEERLRQEVRHSKMDKVENRLTSIEHILEEQGEKLKRLKIATPNLSDKQLLQKLKELHDEYVRRQSVDSDPS